MQVSSDSRGPKFGTIQASGFGIPGSEIET
jgi:hypothetical protein